MKIKVKKIVGGGYTYFLDTKGKVWVAGYNSYYDWASKNAQTSYKEREAFGNEFRKNIKEKAEKKP